MWHFRKFGWIGMVRTFLGDQLTTQFEAKSPKISPSWREQDQSSLDFFSDKLGQDQKKSHLCSAHWGAVKVPFEMTRTFAQWWPSAPVPSQSQKMNPRKVNPELVFDFKLLPRRTTQTQAPPKSHLDIQRFISPNQLARGYGFETRKVMDFGFLSRGSLGEMGRQFLSICPTTEQTLCKSMTLICQVCFLTPMVTIIVWK